MAHEASALTIEKRRLVDTIGGTFSGIVGDPNHSYGYHRAANEIPASDYSRKGLNNPVQDASAACAIDIGMDWPASRSWLRWLIREIREDSIKDVSEVIGSYDGRDVRYWSDGSGWHTNGVDYQGEGHDTWTHVGIYRRDTRTDRGILRGWTARGHNDQGDDMPRLVSVGSRKDATLTKDAWKFLHFDVEYSDPDHDHANEGGPTILQTHAFFSATASATLPNLAPGTVILGRFVECKKSGDEYPIVKTYAPHQLVSPGGAETFLQWSQDGSLDEGNRLRAQVKAVSAPEGQKLVAGRAKVLYWKR